MGRRADGKLGCTDAAAPGRRGWASGASGSAPAPVLPVAQDSSRFEDSEIKNPPGGRARGAASQPNWRKRGGRRDSGWAERGARRALARVQKAGDQAEGAT